MQDREPSHAGVEHADRTLRVHAWMVVGASPSGTHAPLRSRACACSASITSRPRTAARLLAPARAGGWAIEHWHAHAGEPRPILDGVDAVVAYGGTMNPDDDARLAWLADVRATLAEAVERDAAVLGICLGAQLLGQALGAGAPRLAQPELGWFARRADRRAAPSDVLLGPLAPACEVFQWHDYGCELPRRARSRSRAPSARRIRPTASATPSGRCSSTSRSTPRRSSAGRAPCPRSCAPAAPSPPTWSHAPAPTSPSTSRPHARSWAAS